LPTQKSIFTVP